MQEIIFWKNWHRSYKIPYNIYLCLFVASLLIFLICYFRGTETVISWNIVDELESINVVLDKFTLNYYEFNVDTYAYLNFQKFIGSSFNIIYPASIFFIFVSLSLLLLLSALTCLSNSLYYYTGIGIFIFFLLTIKFELFNVSADYPYVLPVIATILYCSASYYFYAFKKDTSFQHRFLIFTIITILLGCVIFLKSNVNHPVLFLTNYGCIVPIILTIIFIFIISFENIANILYLVTRSKSSRNGINLLHFLIFSLLYFLCLILLYIENTSFYDLDLIYLNAFVIFIISAVLGIWGFKKRNIIFKDQLPFTPIGAFIYIGFAIISTITISYYFATGNDMMVEIFEEAIIFAHLVRGGLFFFYILANFSTPLIQNLPVHKIVYQPNRTPFFIVTGLSIVGIVALAFISNDQYDKFIAGYHNGLGDLYTAENNYTLANKYYNDSYVNGQQSHKSVYAMATLAYAQGNDYNAINYYKLTLSIKPTPFSYANLSDIYFNRKNVFRSLLILDEGIKKFPESGELYNNLALIYNQMNFIDSTFFYIDMAKKYSNNKKVHACNLLGFFAKNSMYNQDLLFQTIADSLCNDKNLSNYLPFINNRLVLFNSLPEVRKPLKDKYPFKKDFFNDSLLNIMQFSYLYNYGFYHIKREIEEIEGIEGIEGIEEKIEFYRNQSQNQKYSEDLLFLVTCYNYYINDRGKGKILLDQLQKNSMYMSSWYNNILGFWMLEQGANKIAAEYFNAAKNNLNNNAKINYAFTLSETGDKNSAIDAWKEFINDTNILASIQPLDHKTMKVNMIAKNFIKILSEENVQNVFDWEDDLKLQFIHYRINEFYSNRQKSDFMQIINNINDNTTKLLAATELMDYFIERNDTTQSEQIWERFKNFNLENTYASNKLNFQYLRLLTAKKDFKQLLLKSDQVSLNKEQEDFRLYFKAIAYDNLLDTLNADSLYKWGLKRASFYENGRISAANFYNTKIKNKDYGYDILLEGINLNPYSIKIYKAYILYCLELNLTSYAKQALEELQTLTTEEDFTNFLIKYYKKQTLIEKSQAEWE